MTADNRFRVEGGVWRRGGRQGFHTHNTTVQRRIHASPCLDRSHQIIETV